MSEEKTTEADPEQEKSQPKRLSPEQWREIETHWECGTMRTVEICRHYGITPSAVTQHFDALKKAGTPIIKNSKKGQIQKAAAAAAVAQTAGAVSGFETKRKSRIETTKESLYASSVINHMEFHKIQQQIRAGTITPKEAVSDFKALRMAESFITLNRENRYSLLDVENDVAERDLPVLVFEDLTEAEIKAIQESDDDFDDLDLPIEPASENDEVVETGT
jgi:hypothetical protein